MRYLPIFLDLKRGVVLLAGSGDLARAKLRLLAAAGARVRWYATGDDHDLGGLSAEEASRVELAAGDVLAADLDGVIAVLCAGAGEVGPLLSARAKAVGLPVNVMDDLEHSTFIFPAVVDRGDVVVAVGTGGASPVVARRVRELIETVLPGARSSMTGSRSLRCDAAFGSAWSMARSARLCSPAATTRRKPR
jgi:uroporphyrin-III C-methyltransferase/precorrin-2 dehydrogenase/sirohydrochlorin ferrochelatase